MALAGDPQQAFYGDVELAAAPRGRHTTTIELTTPCRSTLQILVVTGASDAGFSIERAPRGEPVDLVLGHSMRDQAAAVACDIGLLLHRGDRNPADIPVRVSRKWDIGRVVAVLTSVGVPYSAIYPNQADDIDLAEASMVKFLTVRSAKGYDFPVVFRVGLERLTADGSSRATQDSRSGYGGFTRAKHQPVLTYARDNTFLERVRSMPADPMRTWVWPNDYPEGIDG